MPALNLNSSDEKCPIEPMPALPKLIFPGFLFA
jgi:hypothetical protein